MTWAMLSTSPLGTTTFSATGVNLLEGTDVCRLCGWSREDVLHLWAECSATRDLGEVPPEPLFAELLIQDGIEHPGAHPSQLG